MEIENEEFDDFIEHLISIGALDLVGIDPNGEPRYVMTKVCKEVYPQLYEDFMFDVGAFINRLWQLEMVDLNFSDDNVFISLNDNTFNEEKVDMLSDEDQIELLNLIDRYFEKYNNDIMGQGD